MFQAYRNRLEYSGRRERGKFAIQICLWHRSTTWKPHNLSKCAYCRTESSRMFCLPVACCISLSFPEILLFSIANWIVSSGRNMCAASLLQMRIVPLF